MFEEGKLEDSLFHGKIDDFLRRSQKFIDYEEHRIVSKAVPKDTYEKEGAPKEISKGIQVLGAEVLQVHVAQGFSRSAL